MRPGHGAASVGALARGRLPECAVGACRRRVDAHCPSHIPYVRPIVPRMYRMSGASGTGNRERGGEGGEEKKKKKEEIKLSDA